ncbi:hypothetical protein IAE40_00205 [Pseudomonas sp. S44]|uniref:hypothetical protein n=1 Tax=Pseudomonas sp. S44 TaxID=2767450 RepID=UPI00190CB432|nr:hypothetical protein [Pseudomonas sp. S44]MBK0057036.1 hypothetical protein [Pseudomonas sp. S44]
MRFRAGLVAVEGEMLDPIDICKQKVSDIIISLKELLAEIGDQKMARSDRESISNLEINHKNFVGRATKGDVEAAVSSAKGVAVHARALGLAIIGRGSYGEGALKLAKKLERISADFSDRIDNGEEFTLPYVLNVEEFRVASSSEMNINDAHKSIIELQAKLRSDVENFERIIAKGLSDIDAIKRENSASMGKASEAAATIAADLETLRGDIGSIKAAVEREVAGADIISQEAAKRSQQVDSQIDKLLGENAAKVLLIDYANTAREEGVRADKMRYWSLACMGISGLVVFAALYQTLSGNFDLPHILLKVFAALALSVPAAYLARESSRHRIQEHMNRRIALDLRAMTPYIASLPNDEQNKIKSEVASKIFGMQGSIAGGDDYPVNLQELVKLLIEKIPSK